MMGLVASWVGSAWFAALAVLAFWQYSANVSVTSPNRAFATVVALAAAALLLFPPAWNQERQNPWRYVRLFAALVLAAIGLTMPIETHAVRLDLPVPQSSPDGARH